MNNDLIQISSGSSFRSRSYRPHVSVGAFSSRTRKQISPVHLNSNFIQEPVGFFIICKRRRVTTIEGFGSTGFPIGYCGIREYSIASGPALRRRTISYLTRIVHIQPESSATMRVCVPASVIFHSVRRTQTVYTIPLHLKYSRTHMQYLFLTSTIGSALLLVAIAVATTEVMAPFKPERIFQFLIHAEHSLIVFIHPTRTV